MIRSLICLELKTCLTVQRKMVNTNVIVGWTALGFAVVSVAVVYILLFTKPSLFPQGKTSTNVQVSTAAAGKDTKKTLGSVYTLNQIPYVVSNGQVTFNNKGVVTGKVTSTGTFTCTGTSNMKTVNITGGETVTGSTTSGSVNVTSAANLNALATSSIAPSNSALTVNGSLAITRFLGVNTSRMNPDANLGNGTIAAFYDTSSSKIKTVGSNGDKSLCYSSSAGQANILNVFPFNIAYTNSQC